MINASVLREKYIFYFKFKLAVCAIINFYSSCALTLAAKAIAPIGFFQYPDIIM
jgi:hypothetical protein